MSESSKIVRSLGQWTAAKDPIELACDLFAAELLVPLHVLDDYAPDDPFPRKPEQQEAVANMIDRCASRFNVPLGFMRWRLYDLVKARGMHFNPSR